VIAKTVTKAIALNAVIEIATEMAPETGIKTGSDVVAAEIVDVIEMQTKTRIARRATVPVLTGAIEAEREAGPETAIDVTLDVTGMEMTATEVTTTEVDAMEDLGLGLQATIGTIGLA
jgi:hypothetical protein